MAYEKQRLFEMSINVDERCFYGVAKDLLAGVVCSILQFTTLRYWAELQDKVRIK